MNKKQREFIRAVVEETLAIRRLTEDAPLTYRTMSVHFPSRTFTIDDNSTTVEADTVTFPILSTEKPVIPGRRFPF